MRFMIHACPQRMWYVDNFLLPSMLAQGIEREEITVWNDTTGAGNLQSFVQSMQLCGVLKERGVWHMQDDVLLSSSFAERTAALEKARDEPVICGFGCDFGDGLLDYKGRAPAKAMWYSFPCVYIRNELAAEFSAWFEKAKNAGKYREKLAAGKSDDWFFREFFLEKHGGAFAYNVTPSLVEHIDFLIGGTVVNPLRLRKINRAASWEEPEAVEELAARLERYKNK